jgi:hypothetical protein
LNGGGEAENGALDTDDGPGDVEDGAVDTDLM